MAEQSVPSRFSVFTMSLVVTGNLLGAGILALPIKTGLSGFFPSLLGMVLMWGMMLGTAIILSAQKSLTESENADLPTFFGHELGKVGKFVAVVANMIILYGLLVAYISGAGAVIDSLFKTGVPMFIPMSVFFVFAAGMTFFGMVVLRRGSTVIMILMWITFLVLVVMAGEKVSVSRLTYQDWVFLPMTLPVVVTAFHFHNIIPSICRALKFHRRSIITSMFIGTFIGLIMNTLWTFVVIGSLPIMDKQNPAISLDYSFHKNFPATIPLQNMLHSEWFTTIALIFALLAITAAFMANGTALSSFIRDLTTTYFNVSNRVLVACLAFLPPLIVSIIWPAIFLEAVNLVGGVGISTIFGILPGFLLIKYCKGLKRVMGVVLVIGFTFVLVYELGQEFGFLKIRPEVEYWNAHRVWRHTPEAAAEAELKRIKEKE